VQPCDEDDYFFSVFPCNGVPVEWNWQGKTEVLAEKPVPVPFCPPQIPHGLARDRTQASAVRGRRLTAWAMARPYSELLTASLNKPQTKTIVYKCLPCHTYRNYTFSSSITRLSTAVIHGMWHSNTALSLWLIISICHGASKQVRNWTCVLWRALPWLCRRVSTRCLQADFRPHHTIMWWSCRGLPGYFEVECEILDHLHKQEAQSYIFMEYAGRCEVWF
jgi:hypothetical protein